jgi:arylsulfatase A-like enzyme
MGHGFSDEEARLLRELYLGEVESIDGRVGNIIRAVKHMGRLEDTYFVFTSDHGEAFREHGRFVHGGPGFYRELIHVPLIVAGPDLAEGQEIGRMVSHVQLIPTIRTLLDLAPGRGLPAPSLVDPAGGMHGDSRPLYFSGTSDSCYAVLDGDWKLMVNGSDLRLFNLFGDPGELTDVFHNFPGVAARLTEIGRRITADNTAHRIAVEGLSEAGGEQEAELQEIKKTLRSLGYIR